MIQLTGLRILAQLSVPAGNTVLKSHNVGESVLRVLAMKSARQSPPCWGLSRMPFTPSAPHQPNFALHR
jgi:hypothetical protein